jgi:hypothetical protein
LGPAGLNKEIQFNDGGTLGSSSGLSFDKATGTLTVATSITVSGRDLGAYSNAAFLQANTPSNVANSAASYANSGFAVANSSAGYANSAFLRANTPSDVANSAASYANSAFISANAAFLKANTPDYVANSAALYANAAFTRANNSLDANNGGTVTGTITATSFITSGSFGNIQGANTIYANNIVANSGGYIQFGDGSKQYTANAGSGTFGTDAWARGQANAAFAQANTAQSTASSAQGTADSAAGTASAALSAAGTAQSTADSAAIYANGAFAKANTGGVSFGDYFPITTDYGNLTDPSLSAFGELLLVAYDCRIDPITPNGYFLTKDFGYVA